MRTKNTGEFYNYIFKSKYDYSESESRTLLNLGKHVKISFNSATVFIWKGLVQHIYNKKCASLNTEVL